MEQIVNILVSHAKRAETHRAECRDRFEDHERRLVVLEQRMYFQENGRK
jgi:hypothetical protein